MCQYCLYIRTIYYIVQTLPRLRRPHNTIPILNNIGIIKFVMCFVSLIHACIGIIIVLYSTYTAVNSLKIVVVKEMWYFKYYLCMLLQLISAIKSSYYELLVHIVCTINSFAII